MTITTSTLVADIATANPGHHQGLPAPSDRFLLRRPHPARARSASAPDPRGAGADRRARAALSGTEPDVDWTTASLASLVLHIQARFHRPLEEEMPRLRAMVDKVVCRHGARLPRLAPLQATFAGCSTSCSITWRRKTWCCSRPSSRSKTEPRRPIRGWTWIDQPIVVMEAEHASAGAALARIAELTDGHVPPADACPTFRGLYHGLAELEREMHLHVHLENHILFPRAAALARSCTSDARARAGGPSRRRGAGRRR